VDEAQARSALLFGPPGTGKTTLVEALAGAIGWDYLEILPSAFLTDGIDYVAARAETIFSQLMELNRCVILFDEIDELIRDRGDVFSDPFGRFLTTTMLPKLAKLWAQRRVLFFANTNWIAKADPAIRRTQRFDAVLFAGPPSIARKRVALKELLVKADYAKVNEAAVVDALSNQEDPLGWLALMRHQHIIDLQQLLKKPGSQRATYRELRDALQTIGFQLEKTDWHLPATDELTSQGQSKGKSQKPYALFVEMANNESVDGSRECLAWLRPNDYSGGLAKPGNLLAIDSRSRPKNTLEFQSGEGIRGPLLQYI